ncbi:TIGR01906 family membrane protein [Anaerorhabdus furcosa]|uniref:Integral membrane protein TIGR01906 n=1 Tax=Anaerorhabdus furcosa TaxID=118967 RepID=A0A1T4PF09_9FIRM|nr:TIGR01906 family membrane protein [Anaerorhabdus furcosa]SJZ90069.1 integral membrane protein TIGR01906 [Anaerorhabdus furcosa]
MKHLSKPCFFIATICFIVAFFLTCLDFNSFNHDFYKSEYDKLGVADEIGISRVELQETTDVLLDYIQDKRDDLNVSAVILGQERQVFNEKEIMHMVDVKDLYLTTMNVRMMTGIGFIVFGLLGILFDRKNALRNSTEMFIMGTVSALTLILFLGMYAMIDFDQFWLQFHYIFFTNDLFLLDPATDILIQMVPSQFFFDLVFRIAGTFLLGMVVLCGGCFYIRRKSK